MEELLEEIFHRPHSRFECESESTCSAMSDGGGAADRVKLFSTAQLAQMSVADLRELRSTLTSAVAEMSSRLVRILKNRDRLVARLRGRSDVVTAVLQATSPKRSVDTKLQFSLDPPPNNPSGFDQWRDAMRAVAKLPDGMPPQFRQRLWLSLATNYLSASQVDWDEVRLAVFSDRLHPDDHKLGRQIIKDLHRTGWTGLTGEREQSGLKRVLLAYARYNPAVGYCQGFNVIAARLMEVMGFDEENSLKVMILLVEKVLPTNYFDQNLRALSVDMAVQRQLLRQRLPRLSGHLDRLQKDSVCPYEPPLTNVFTMQWFLTLFATCLPQQTVFRVWDSLLLEGSEILLRTAIAIWSRMGRRIYKAQTADDFYGVMGPICQDLLQMSADQSNELMQTIYSMAEFPYPGLAELRERFTWNVQPLSSTFKLFRSQVQQVLGGEQDDSDSQEGFACLAAMKTSDRSRSEKSTPTEENVDLSALNKQYRHLKQRQEQAAVILQNAYAHGQKRIAANPSLRSSINSEGFAVFNHLHFGATRKTDRSVPFSNGISVSSVTVQPKSSNGAKKGEVTTFSMNNLGYGVSAKRPVVNSRGTDGASISQEDSSASATPVASRPSLDLLDLNSPTEADWAAQFSRSSSKLIRRRWKSCPDAKLVSYRTPLVEVRMLRRNWSCVDRLIAGSSQQQERPVEETSRKSHSSGHARSSFDGPSNYFTFEVTGSERIKVRRSQTGSDLSRADKQSERKTSTVLLSKSKKIIDAAADAVRRSQVAPPCRNPFPVAHKTAMIERGRKFGLYS